MADPADPPVERLSLGAWNRRTSGAIVNIASTRALQSEPNTEAYAQERSSRGKTTRSIRPGAPNFVVDGGMTRKMIYI